MIHAQPPQIIFHSASGTSAPPRPAAPAATPHPLTDGRRSDRPPNAACASCLPACSSQPASQPTPPPWAANLWHRSQPRLRPLLPLSLGRPAAGRPHYAPCGNTHNRSHSLPASAHAHHTQRHVLPGIAPCRRSHRLLRMASSPPHPPLAGAAAIPGRANATTRSAHTSHEP